MRPARAAYLLGGILLAAWLASAAGVVGRPSIPPLPRLSPEDARLDAVASGVQAQAARLRQRLAVAPMPHPSTRNPFSFAAREIVAAPVARPVLPVSVPDVEPPAPEPPLALLGFAEDGSTRTAMIASGDELVMATEGQTVAGRYRVGKVGADVVELIDLITGATRRLGLKSPVLLP